MSTAYWERRYANGGISGAGSRGPEALLKMRLAQHVITECGVSSVLDLGCGDGHVAAGLGVPFYTGYDPSPTALAMARDARPVGFFVNQLPCVCEQFDLVLSMDVIFHLVTHESYKAYMKALFAYAPLVLVYGTNKDLRGHHHVLHRRWLQDVPPGWRIAEETATPYKKHAWLLQKEAN